jgi:hypothetical protein
MIETAIALFALVSLPLVVTIALVVRGRPRPHDEDDEDGKGGGSDRLPRRPLEPSGHGEPSWWPRFERELAAYAENQRAAPTSKQQ